jgi:CRISPR-associated protein Cmr6
MSNLSRRKDLADVRITPHTHAGVWLDRYLERQNGIHDQEDPGSEKAKTARTELIKQVSNTSRAAQGYRQAFERRFENTAANPHEYTAFCTFRCVGKMIIGLGQKGVIESGITLEKAWGVPILPGPAMKGVAASTAHLLVEDPSWNKGIGDQDPGVSAAHLFGTTKHAGCVTFHDAWWIAEQENQRLPIHADIITPHNSHYYREGKTPDGMASPIPVSFLSASGTYMVMLSGLARDKAWVDAAMQLLTLGLRHLGIGAKTNAGYGRFEPNTAATDQWKERITKLERKASLAQKSLDGILMEAFPKNLSSKNGVKTFTTKLNKVMRGEHCELSDLFYYNVFSEALDAYDGATHTSDEQVQEALKATLRSHDITRSWVEGVHGSDVKNPRGESWMKKAADWAGIQEESAPAPSQGDNHLVKCYPKAVNMPQDAQAAFLQIFHEDGSLNSDQFLELSDDQVMEWGDDALAIYMHMMDQID